MRDARFRLVAVLLLTALGTAACGSTFVHAGQASNPVLFTGPAAAKAETAAATAVTGCGRSSGTITAINYTTNPLVVHGITPGPQAASSAAIRNLGGCLYSVFAKAGPSARTCALEAFSVFGYANGLSGLADSAITCLAETTTPASTAVPTAPVKATAKQAGTVTETGSTLMLPLLSAWQAAYSAQTHASVSTAGTGSGTGIADAGLGAVSFGASDAYLTPADQAKYPGLINIPLAVSALNVDYNLHGVTGLRLNGAVLAAIYNGKITQWDDPAIRALNPGVKLPAEKIVPLHRADGSGSSFLFTSYLNAQDPHGWPSAGVSTSPSWPTGVSEVGTNGMIKGCSQTPGCVGYVGISYAKPAAAAGLAPAVLENGSGNFAQANPAEILKALVKFAPATPGSGAMEMINASVGYPIINYEYAIVKPAQPSATQAAAVRNFLNWSLTTGSGPQYLDAVGFLPLPAYVQALAQNMVRGIQ
jgi:phosphate transport system substrate-binding protein